MSWPIMGSIQELQANSRPMTTPRLSCLWWPERSTLMVGKRLRQTFVCARSSIFFFFFLKLCFHHNVLQERFWSLGEALQISQMLQRHLRYVACFVFCRSFNIAESISSCSLSLSLSLLGDCSSYQRLSGAAKGAWGHHFCPSWRPQLSGRSQSDGRSWYVVHSLCTDLYLDLLSVKACLECIFYLQAPADFHRFNLVLSALLRQDHWDPHPRLRHRNSHDCHCRHGTGPSANPQPASCCCPHCQLPPQLQRQHIGMTHTDSTETNGLPWSCVGSQRSQFTSSAPPVVWFSLVLEWAEDLHAIASVSVITVLSF